MLDFVCPDDGGKLKFILNSRMDETQELIPVCEQCKKAFRDKSLGWLIMEELENIAKLPEYIIALRDIALQTNSFDLHELAWKEFFKLHDITEAMFDKFAQGMIVSPQSMLLLIKAKIK